MAFIGHCDHPPSKAMLEELEAELDGLRRERIYGISDAQVLDTVRARRVVVMWKLRHRLEPRPEPSNGFQIMWRSPSHGGRRRLHSVAQSVALNGWQIWARIGRTRTAREHEIGFGAPPGSDS